MLSFQNNLNVILLKRGDCKLSIGSLDNKFPCTVQKSLQILQFTLFANSRFQHGSQYVKSNTKNDEPKLEKQDKTVKLNNNNIVKMSSWFDPRV